MQMSTAMITFTDFAGDQMASPSTSITSVEQLRAPFGLPPVEARLPDFGSSPQASQTVFISSI
jgi:hypothetical protein